MKAMLWIGGVFLIVLGSYQHDDFVKLAGTVFMVGYAVCYHIDNRLVK